MGSERYCLSTVSCLCKSRGNVAQGRKLDSVWFDLRLACVVGANVRGKLLVAPCLKVPQHRVESGTVRRPLRVEYPRTLGTAPTAKARLVYPHQLAQHGGIIYKESRPWFRPSAPGRAINYDSEIRRPIQRWKSQ